MQRREHLFSETMRGVLLSVFLFVSCVAQAQDSPWRVEHGVQLWLMTTIDARIDPSENASFERVRPHGDLFVRRGRVRLRATPLQSFELLLQLQYDGLQQDAGTLGAVKPQPGPAVGVRDVAATWRAERFKVQVGYFHPATTHEGERSAFSIRGFEKSDLQTYVRLHTTGERSGRMAGLQAGLEPGDASPFGATLGVFDPLDSALVGTGLVVNPVFVGRLTFRRRYGELALSVSATGTWQGKSEVFRQNAAVGGAFELSTGPLLVEAEGHGLVREMTGWKTESVWMGRLAWELPFGRQRVTPTLTWTGYRASTGGRHDVVEGALGWAPSEQLRIAIAVHWQNGSAPSLWSDGASFRQGPWGAVGIQHEL